MCTYYYKHDKTYPSSLSHEVGEALKKLEKIMGRKYGDPKNPQLLSVRSGSRGSMPGMMDTVLNPGLNDETIKGRIAHTANERFAYDAYRRLVMMYADVVMEKAAGIDPKQGKGIRRILEDKMDDLKHKMGYENNTDLTADDLKYLVTLFKRTIKEILGIIPDFSTAKCENKF